jgi:hypothetical protein
MDNNCTKKDSNGKLVYDTRCDTKEYVDAFGLNHKSRGYMCSGYGTDIGFEECNSNKCKVGTLKGCPIDELEQLIKSNDLDVSRISGQT